MNHKHPSRAAAQAAGAKKYFTGQPCSNGHISSRYTQSGTCCECVTRSGANSRNQANGGLVKLSGVLVHRDDLAAALAYIAALNIQRGFLPPPAPGVAVPIPQPVDIAAARARIFHQVESAPLPDWKP